MTAKVKPYGTSISLTFVAENDEAAGKFVETLLERLDDGTDVFFDGAGWVVLHDDAVIPGSPLHKLLQAINKP